jgi:hypothetical protein
MSFQGNILLHYGRNYVVAMTVIFELLTTAPMNIQAVHVVCILQRSGGTYGSIFIPWEWRQHCPLRRCSIATTTRGITLQKTLNFETLFVFYSLENLQLFQRKAFRVTWMSTRKYNTYFALFITPKHQWFLTNEFFLRRLLSLFNSVRNFVAVACFVVTCNLLGIYLGVVKAGCFVLQGISFSKMVVTIHWLQVVVNRKTTMQIKSCIHIISKFMVYWSLKKCVDQLTFLLANFLYPSVFKSQSPLVNIFLVRSHR